MIFNLKNSLNTITIENLKKYLDSNGWKINDEFPNRKLILFEKNYDGQRFTITIPAKETFKDYIVRLNDVVLLLEELEGKATNKIVEEILKVNNKLLLINEHKNENKRDKLSIRIISEISKTGDIPLEYGSNVMEGLKKLILSALYNEEFPRPYFIRTNKDSHDSLSKFKLAQTNIGSYTFNIEIENDKYEQIRIDDRGYIEEISQTRRVIKRIQNGIGGVVNTIEQGELNLLLEEGYKKGLNANMCDAILNFKHEKYEVKIESTVTWSDLLPKPTDILEKVIINNNDFYIIKTLSEKYKETGIIEAYLKGKIITLNNRQDSKGISLERFIIIQAEIDGTRKKVKVPLNKSDYEKACEIHKQNQEISIIGELKKEGRTWILYNYKNFILVN